MDLTQDFLEANDRHLQNEAKAPKDNESGQPYTHVGLGANTSPSNFRRPPAANRRPVVYSHPSNSSLGLNDDRRDRARNGRNADNSDFAEERDVVLASSVLQTITDDSLNSRPTEDEFKGELIPSNGDVESKPVEQFPQIDPEQGNLEKQHKGLLILYDNVLLQKEQLRIENGILKKSLEALEHHSECQRKEMIKAQYKLEKADNIQREVSETMKSLEEADERMTKMKARSEALERENEGLRLLEVKSKIALTNADKEKKELGQRYNAIEGELSELASELKEAHAIRKEKQQALQSKEDECKKLYGLIERLGTWQDKLKRELVQKDDTQILALDARLMEDPNHRRPVARRESKAQDPQLPETLATFVHSMPPSSRQSEADRSIMVSGPQDLTRWHEVLSARQSLFGPSAVLSDPSSVPNPPLIASGRHTILAEPSAVAVQQQLERKTVVANNGFSLSRKVLPHLHGPQVSGSWTSEASIARYRHGKPPLLRLPSVPEDFEEGVPPPTKISTHSPIFIDLEEVIANGTVSGPVLSRPFSHQQHTELRRFLETARRYWKISEDLADQAPETLETAFRRSLDITSRVLEIYTEEKEVTTGDCALQVSGSESQAPGNGSTTTLTPVAIRAVGSPLSPKSGERKHSARVDKPRRTELAVYGSGISFNPDAQLPSASEAVAAYPDTAAISRAVQHKLLVEMKESIKRLGAVSIFVTNAEAFERLSTAPRRKTEEQPRALSDIGEPRKASLPGTSPRRSGSHGASSGDLVSSSSTCRTSEPLDKPQSIGQVSTKTFKQKLSTIEDIRGRESTAGSVGSESTTGLESARNIEKSFMNTPPRADKPDDLEVLPRYYPSIPDTLDSSSLPASSIQGEIKYLKGTMAESVDVLDPPRIFTRKKIEELSLLNNPLARSSDESSSWPRTSTREVASNDTENIELEDWNHRAKRTSSSATSTISQNLNTETDLASLYETVESRHEGDVEAQNCHAIPSSPTTTASSSASKRPRRVRQPLAATVKFWTAAAWVLLLGITLLMLYANFSALLTPESAEVPALTCPPHQPCHAETVTVTAWSTSIETQTEVETKTETRTIYTESPKLAPVNRPEPQPEVVGIKDGITNHENEHTTVIVVPVAMPPPKSPRERSPTFPVIYPQSQPHRERSNSSTTATTTLLSRSKRFSAGEVDIRALDERLRKKDPRRPFDGLSYWGPMPALRMGLDRLRYDVASLLIF